MVRIADEALAREVGAVRGDDARVAAAAGVRDEGIEGRGLRAQQGGLGLPVLGVRVEGEVG